MPRGRGILEIKPSSNPFYETTGSTYGQKIDIESVAKKAPTSTQSPEQKGFNFLYSRTSDVYGRDPMASTSVPSFDFEDTSSFHDSFSPSKLKEDKSLSSSHRVDVAGALSLYTHKPKKENALYSTSACEIGKKPPTEATFVAERMHRSQAFSNSFNHMKNQSSALNTGLTKSTIHPTLDPQFT